MSSKFGIDLIDRTLTQYIYESEMDRMDKQHLFETALSGSTGNEDLLKTIRFLRETEKQF